MCLYCDPFFFQQFVDTSEQRRLQNNSHAALGRELFWYWDYGAGDPCRVQKTFRLYYRAG